jgi:hypothetical protein
MLRGLLRCEGERRGDQRQLGVIDARERTPRVGRPVRSRSGGSGNHLFRIDSRGFLGLARDTVDLADGADDGRRVDLSGSHCSHFSFGGDH